MSYSWIKFRAANLRNPAFRKLIKSGEDHLCWWLSLCLIAAESDNEGRLTYGRDIPWTADELSDHIHATPQQTRKFIELALRLDLLEETEDGTLRLIDWEDWYGQNALTNAERQKRWREKNKVKPTTDPQTDRNDAVTDDNERSLSDRNESNDPKKSRAEQRRAEEEKSRAEQIAQARDACPPAPFGKDEFLRTCSEVLPHLTKTFTAKDSKLVLQRMDENPWTGFSWEDRAGALQLAVGRGLYRIDQGESPKKLLPWLLSWAWEQLDLAADMLGANKVAVEYGFEPKPLIWTPEVEE